MTEAGTTLCGAVVYSLRDAASGSGLVSRPVQASLAGVQDHKACEHFYCKILQVTEAVTPVPAAVVVLGPGIRKTLVTLHERRSCRRLFTNGTGPQTRGGGSHEDAAMRFEGY